MEKLLKFMIYFARNLLLARGRYFRLVPFFKGKVYFYDRMKKSFFNVKVRDKIDSRTADQIFKYNDYDLSFLKRYDELLERYERICSLNKKPLIIDCGANIGLSAMHFATTFPKSIVISIEPEANNFSLMKENCNGFGTIEFLNKAIGSSDGYVSINNLGADNDAFRTSRSESDEGDVEVVSVNSILKRYSELVPFIIKIDIEGFEDDLFSTNTEWVEKFPLLIIETHDWMLPKQSNSHNFLKVISNQSRDFIHRGENVFSISND